MELPRGATAVDFAYMVHTDVGKPLKRGSAHQPELMPLRTELRNGDPVEVVTAPTPPMPPGFPMWTGRARSKIRTS